jgi:outer membrane protein assembly factor BamB
LKRDVALKMILAGNFASEEELTRFQSEAKAAGNLDHPNIVPIYEIGEHDGHHYFSMKLVTGGDLRDVISTSHVQSGTKHQKQSTKNQRQIAELMATVARAVHHAHQRGVLHRDLKPGNILLDEDGQPHITDFGLAKQFESDSDLTRTGAVMGTPSYMSPEQARGEKTLTTAADVYSLGAVLYELLTGVPPFQKETTMATQLAVLNDNLEAPRKRNSTIAKDLETICLHCLHRDYRHRYQSAGELADELDRFLNSQLIVASRPGPVKRGLWALWRRRRALLMLAVGAVATGFLIVMQQFYSESRQGALSVWSADIGVKAEVLDQADQQVILPFPLPNKEPEAIAPGSYILRVDGPGLLHSRIPFEIGHGELRKLIVSLSGQQCWAPVELGRDSDYTVEHLEDRADLLIATKDKFVRIDGRSLTPIWQIDFTPVDGEATSPAHSAMRRLLGYLAGEDDKEYKSARIMQPAPDLDDDGVSEVVVIPKQAEDGILVLSGRNGEFMWHWKAELPERPKTKAQSLDTPRFKHLGQPAAVDCDGDGRLDLVVTIATGISLWSQQADRVTPPLASCVAIGGLSGQRLWRYDHPPEAYVYKGRDYDPNRFGTPGVVRETDKGKAVSSYWRKKSIILDLKDGMPIEATIVKTAVRPGKRGLDLDDDGHPERFTARLQTNQNGGDSTIELSALSGADGSILWKQIHPVSREERGKVDAPIVWGYDARSNPRLVVATRSGSRANGYIFTADTGKLTDVIENFHRPATADFTGDGLSDLYWFERRSTMTARGFIHALEATPATSWRCASSVIKADDLNGDGCADVVAGQSGRPVHWNVKPRVVARSGRDGSIIWETDLLAARVIAPQNLDLDKDGTADVIVLGCSEEAASLQRGWIPSEVIVLSGKTGRKIVTVGPIQPDEMLENDLFYPVDVICADLNGDGTEEFLIYGRWEGRRSGGYNQGSYSVRQDALCCVSKSGDLQWDCSLPGESSHPFKFSSIRLANLDGRGNTDIVFVEYERAVRGTRLVGVAGDSGDILFKRQYSGLDKVRPTIPIADLDGDGIDEIVVAADRVECINGADGTAHWQYEWGKGYVTRSSYPQQTPVVVRGDQDGPRRVCVRDSNAVLVLDKSGVVRSRPTPAKMSNYAALGNFVRNWAVDADGDGQDDLLMQGSYQGSPGSPRYGRLGVLRMAKDLTGEVMWEWRMPQRYGKVLEIMPQKDGRPPIVVVCSGDSIYGLDAQTGAAHWRCHAPLSRSLWLDDDGLPSSKDFDNFRPLILEDGSELPNVVFSRVTRVAGQDHFESICKRALATEASGKYKGTSTLRAPVKVD